MNRKPFFRSRSLSLLFVTLAAALPLTGCNAQSAGTQQKLTSLRELHDSGVLSDAEYQQKVAALQPAKAAAGPAAASASGMPSMSPTVPHEVQDAALGVPWGRVLLPAGWGFNGGVIRANNCAVMGPSTMVAGEAPDHLYGFIMLPMLKTSWGSNQQIVSQMQRGGCPIVHTTSAEVFARTAVLPNLQLQNMKVESAGPEPDLQKAAGQLRAQMEQMQQQSRQMGLSMPQPRHNFDGEQVTVSFDRNGQKMRGGLGVVTDCTEQTMPMVGSPSGMQMNECTAPLLVFFYAPADKLEGFIKTTFYKVENNPAWQQRQNQVAQQETQRIIAQGNAQLQATHNQIMANQNAQFERGQAAHAAQMQSYAQYNAGEAARSNAVHQSNQAFAAHMGDYNDYTNTATGQTVRASNQYNDTYVDSTGTTMLQTNQPGTPGVDWSLMVPRFK